MSGVTGANVITSLTRIVGNHDTPADATGRNLFSVDDIAEYLAHSTFMGVGISNVLDPTYGATGTGGVSDAGALNAAVGRIGSAGGTVACPPGSYRLDASVLLNVSSRLTIWSPVRWGASLFSTTPGLPLFTFTGGSSAGTIILDGLDIDGRLATAIQTNGTAFYGDFILRNCFVRGGGINLVGMTNVTIEDCWFEGYGKLTFSALGLSGAAGNIRIRRNRFRYLQNGANVANASGLSRNVSLADNEFDMGWYTFAADFSGTATGCTATTLTDSAAAFSGITNGAYVRRMPLIGQGTTTTLTRTRVVDSNAVAEFGGFGGSAPGDIVKVGTAMAVVASVISSTELAIEEWLSDSDRTVVATPSAGAYNLYRTVLGRVTGITATTITVANWIDINGGTYTTSNDRYEICKSLGNYPILLDATVQGFSIVDNLLQRGMSDQIGVFGSRGVISRNRIRYGQDMGITMDVGSSDIDCSHNLIEHQGAGCIYSAGNDHTIATNKLYDAYCVQGQSTVSGAIQLQNANRNGITGNSVKRVSSANHLYGVSITGTSANNRTTANAGQNLPNALIHLDGAGVTGTQSVNDSEAPVPVNGATIAAFLPATQTQIDTTSGATLAALETNVNKLVTLLQGTALAKV